MTARPSAQFSAQSGDQSTPNTRAQSGARTRRRNVTVLALICIVVMIAVVEIAARIVVTNIAEQQVEQSLPAAVTAEVTATPTGWCVTCEVIAGKLSGVDLSSDNLRFDDMRGTGQVQARGIAFRGASGADAITGAIEVSEHDLNVLLQRVAADSGLQINDVQVTDRGVSYATSFDAFGQNISLDVTASIHTRGDGQLQIRGESVSIASTNHGAALTLDPQRFTFQTCLASRLPKELEITHVETAADMMRVQLRTREAIHFDGSAFQQLGSC